MNGVKDSAACVEGMGLDLPIPHHHAEKQPYKAFQLSEEMQPYLEMRLKEPEPAECPSNARLSNIRAEWRTGQSITLEYGIEREGMQMMVCIYGENLSELYRAIKAWKVEWIAEFSPEEHQPPTNATAPFIRSITIHSKRPESSPPPSKRH